MFDLCIRSTFTQSTTTTQSLNKTGSYLEGTPSIQQQTLQHAMHISDSKLVSSTPAKQQSSGI